MLAMCSLKLPTKRRLVTARWKPPEGEHVVEGRIMKSTATNPRGGGEDAKGVASQSGLSLGVIFSKLAERAINDPRLATA